MKALAIEQIDVSTGESKVRRFAAGKNAEVKVWFNRELTEGEGKRAKEVAESVLAPGENESVSVGSAFATFYVRGGGPVERFVEIVKSDGSKWDDEVSQELKRAEADLEALESSLRAFVKQ
jgi:hypothetical protein